MLSLADLLDRRSTLCIALMMLCFVPLAVLEAHSKLLSNDEIYTVHIAQAPTIRSMLALSREIDLHPPVHYLAQRLALHTPAPRWLASRLPSILAGIIVCLALFRYTASRISNLFGLVAVAVFWFGPILDSAWINRPYMIWMALLCLLLLARDAAIRNPKPPWAVPLVFLITLAMVMTHLIGVACILPFLLAELVRAKSRRRIDWPLLIALASPALLGLGFFYQIHHLSENTFPASQLASWDMFSGIYVAMVGNTIMILAGIALAVTLLFPRITASPPIINEVNTEQPATSFTLSDAILLATTLAMPLLLLLPAAVLHLQFWLRYGAAAMPGWSMLCAWMVARRLPRPRIVAVLLVAASVGYMVQRMVADTGPQTNPGTMSGGRLPIPLRTLDPTLPIVTASPMTFVEMSDREKPEIVSRVFYLTDRSAAIQYSHYTLFENEDKIRKLLGLPSQTEALAPFLSEHPRFYVVGDYARPEIWLLRKLAADGMTLNYLGKFESTYESDDLYLVTR